MSAATTPRSESSFRLRLAGCLVFGCEDRDDRHHVCDTRPVLLEIGGAPIARVRVVPERSRTIGETIRG